MTEEDETGKTSKQEHLHEVKNKYTQNIHNQHLDFDIV